MVNVSSRVSCSSEQSDARVKLIDSRITAFERLLEK